MSHVIPRPPGTDALSVVKRLIQLLVPGIPWVGSIRRPMTHAGPIGDRGLYVLVFESQGETFPFR